MSNSRLTKFDKRILSLPQSTVMQVAKIDQLQGQWLAGAKLTPQVLNRLKKSVLITSTGASTRIEGSSLSDIEVERLMQGLTMQKMKDRDAQEVRGYYELLNFVFEEYENIRISENTTKQLHAELLKYSSKDVKHKGQYKQLENRVEATDPKGKIVNVVFETTPMFLTSKEMGELFDWLTATLDRKEHHPLLIIACFTVDFLKIHPFLDGNGRLSRILTNLLLIQNGYKYVPYVSHEKLIEDNKSEYYVALRRSQKTFASNKESIEDWVDFFLKILSKQTQESLKLLSYESIDKLLSQNQLKVWEYMKTSSTESSIKDILLATKIARPTIRQAVNKLLKLNKIERIGLGRATRYKKTK